MWLPPFSPLAADEVIVEVEALVTVVEATMSGTVESYGDEEKEGLKEVYMGLLACEEPDCTVSIDVKAGSVIIAATATSRGSTLIPRRSCPQPTTTATATATATAAPPRRLELCP